MEGCKAIIFAEHALGQPYDTYQAVYPHTEIN